MRSTVGDSATVTSSMPAPASGFRHEALLYAGMSEFLDGSVAFINGAVDAGEPVLVAVSAEKIDLLKAELDTDSAKVAFADMAQVGHNPAAIIPVWRDFVAQHAASGRGLRGIGEPVYPSRSPAELAECQRHEDLLNLAFDGSPAWWLLCPYDTEALDPPVIDEARRSHPFLMKGNSHWESTAYRGVDTLADQFAEPLPEPSVPAFAVPFTHESLWLVRHTVAEQAMHVGLDPDRIDDLSLVMHELATNSIRYGGGHGMLRVWSDGDTLVAEIDDSGHIADLLVGRSRPSLDREGGRGIWMANQLCDLVQIRSSVSGTVVRVHVHTH